MQYTGTINATGWSSVLIALRNIALLLVCLLFVIPGSGHGESESEQFSASTYLGYSFGMGKMFRDSETVTSRSSSTAGASFGAIFHYSVGLRTQIGLELMLQDYTYEFETLGNPVNSSGKMRTDILLHGMLSLTQSDNYAVHLTLGVGYYDFGDGGAGFNAGMMYRGSDLSGTAIFVAPRIHFSLSDSGDLYQMMQLAVGIRLPL